MSNEGKLGPNAVWLFALATLGVAIGTTYLNLHITGAITPNDEPNILIETSWDDKGEIDRISFLAEVVGGQQKITKILPKLGK
jgi:hypothetical protein